MRRLLPLTASVLLLFGLGDTPVNADEEEFDLEIAIAGPDGISRGALGVDPRYKPADEIYTLAIEQGFKGEIAVSIGGLMSHYVSPDMAREGYVVFAGEPAIWPFASLTKQMLAAKLVGELDNSNFDLDTPVSKLIPAMDKRDPVPTLRQLLQHRSGLRNPEDTPIEANGWPAFYNNPDQYGLDWCLKGRSAPPAKGWRYNNCDYIVLGAVFDELSFADVNYMLGREDDAHYTISQHFITPENVDKLYKIKRPESDVLPAYGASAALAGTTNDILMFNWHLMLSYDEATDSRREFWQGDPELGYMALGQWVHTVQFPQCDAPVTVAERHGGVGQYRLRNIMLPELQRSFVIATVDPDFEFGEIWAQTGFIYSAVASLACTKGGKQ